MEVIALGDWSPPLLRIDRGDIEFSQESTIRSPDGADEIEMRQHTHATVGAVTVTIHAVARVDTGERVTVRVSVDGQAISATVDIDGEPVSLPPI
jgi:hypothetical protein